MSLDQADMASLLFKQNGISELLSCISEEEKLSPEAEQLLLDIGAGIFSNIVEDACFSAKSRGSDTVEQSDLQFISEPWTKSDKTEPKPENEEVIFHNENTGSTEHQQILEMIRNFKEMNNQESTQ